MLQIYTGLPLGLNSQIDLADTYTGDGITSTFNLVYKTGARLGAVIQFDSIQYSLYNQGYTKTNNSFTTLNALLQPTPPVKGSQGYAPGVSTLTFSAYDVASVPGNTTANVALIPFILADITEIQNYQYIAYPNLSGIQIAFVDLVTALGIQSAWTQLASSGNFGAVGNFAAAQQALITSPLSAFGQLASGCGPGSNLTVLCTNASSFLANDYIMVNPGFPTMEVCRIQSLTANGFVLDGMNYQHFTGEAVYTCGRLFYAMMTVPLNQFGGQAQTLFELGLQVSAGKVARA